MFGSKGFIIESAFCYYYLLLPVSPSTLWLAFAGKETMLNIYLDTMDQAKFRCPRNVSMSKELQAHWRPMLHMTGGMIDGLHECFHV